MLSGAASPTASSPGRLESPITGSYESGVELSHGWVCNAAPVKIEIDGGGRPSAGHDTEQQAIHLIPGSDGSYPNILSINGSGYSRLTVEPPRRSFGASYRVTTHYVLASGVESTINARATLRMRRDLNRAEELGTGFKDGNITFNADGALICNLEKIKANTDQGKGGGIKVNADVLLHEAVRPVPDI